MSQSRVSVRDDGATADPDPAAFRWRDLVTVPRAGWLVTAVFAALLICATALYPPYRGPDEARHVDLVVGLAHGLDPLWAPDQREVARGVLAAIVVPTQRPPGYRLDPHELVPRDQRRTFTEAGGDASWGAANQLVQHPPLFYLAEAAVLRVVPGWEDQPFDRVVGLLRLVGLLMVVPLPLLAFATARRLSRSRVVPLLAALGILGLPQLVHVSACVTNDTLQNLLGGLATVLVAYVATGDLTRRTAMVAGVVLGLALLTKGLLLVYVPVFLLAYLLPYLPAWLPGRRRGGLGRAVGSASIVMAVAFVVGGWWWLRNLVELGRVQPSGVTTHVEVVRGLGGSAVRWGGEFAFYVNSRFWFDMGWVTSGPQAPLSVLALLVALLLVGTAVARRSSAPVPPQVLLLLLAPLVLCLLLLLSGSWVAFTQGVDRPAFQGRYLFPGLVGASVVVAVGLRRLLPRTSPVVLVSAWVGWCTITQLLGVGTALWLYFRPADGGPWSLVTGLLAVQPWPDAVSAVVGLATVVLVPVAIVSVVRSARD